VTEREVTEREVTEREVTEREVTEREIPMGFGVSRCHDRRVGLPLRR